MEPQTPEWLRERPETPDADSGGSALYPLLFTPVYKSYLWGGTRLANIYGRADAPAVCAESWEIADRDEGMSVVRNGALAGTTLHALVAQWGRELVGSAAGDATAFPLLIKLIDARQRLSVQVHPDNAGAARHGGEPKAEAWVVMRAAPGAAVFCGWSGPMTHAAFRAALAAGEVQRVLRRIPAAAGATFFVPGGRVHAIGEGCLMLEVQQNSNTTYRVYDWNRVAADGRPRDSHLEQALQVINWDDQGVQPAQPARVSPGGANARWLLMQSPYFRIERLDLDAEASVLHDPASFTALFVVGGAAECAAGNGEVRLDPGVSCLIPAGLPRFTLRPMAAGTVLIMTRLVQRS